MRAVLGALSVAVAAVDGTAVPPDRAFAHINAKASKAPCVFHYINHERGLPEAHDEPYPLDSAVLAGAQRRGEIAFRVRGRG